MELGSLSFLLSKQGNFLLATFSVTHREEIHSVYCEYLVDRNIHKMLSMPEPLKLSYTKYIVQMNDLETMQKVILGVFLVTEVYFGDLHYIGCLKVS